MNAGDWDAKDIADADWPVHLMMVPGAMAGGFLPGACQLTKLSALLKTKAKPGECRNVSDLVRGRGRWELFELVGVATSLGIDDFEKAAETILQSLRVIDHLCLTAQIMPPPTEAYKVARLEHCRFHLHHFNIDCIREQSEPGKRLNGNRSPWARPPTEHDVLTLSQIQDNAVQRQQNPWLARRYPPSCVEQLVLEAAAVCPPRLVNSTLVPLRDCPGSILQNTTELRAVVNRGRIDMCLVWQRYPSAAAESGIHNRKGAPDSAYINCGQIGHPSFGWASRPANEPGKAPEVVALLYNRDFGVVVRAPACTRSAAASGKPCIACVAAKDRVARRAAKVAKATAAPPSSATPIGVAAANPILAARCMHDQAIQLRVARKEAERHRNNVAAAILRHRQGIEVDPDLAAEYIKLWENPI